MAGLKRIHHPAVGDLELSYEAMELPVNPGWTMFAYTAEPGSASEKRLKLPASWAATTTSELPPPFHLAEALATPFTVQPYSAARK